MLSKHGGTQDDIKRRLYLARFAFVTLKQLWRCTKTKLKIFRSNVVEVLLHGAEMWRMTRTDEKILNVFSKNMATKNPKDTLANENIQ